MPQFSGIVWALIGLILLFVLVVVFLRMVSGTPNPEVLDATLTALRNLRAA